ncbi:MAG: DUF5050 domain-containing protein [Eubacteriales bacterium]
MRKSEKQRIYNGFNKNHSFAYIKIIALILVGVFALSGCSSQVTFVNSPTPIPSSTPAPTSALAKDTLSSSGSSAATSSNTSPAYDETYPIPEILGNTGANIETGGLSTSDANRIYYIDNGIVSMSKTGENPVLITDMQNISCLNNVGEYIYFISTHDGSIYRVAKATDAIPEFLNITGASNLIVIGDYMYYCSTVDESATNYVYRSPLQGIVQECLFVKADYITPDGSYFYFNNLEDNGSLWRYDTILSQAIKISSDKASQINIIDDKLYYISENFDYNVVCIDRNGLNQVTVVTQGCTDLNKVQNYLIYRTIDTGYIQSYNLKTGETISLISYGNLFSLSTTGSMIFFQSCPADGMEPETFIYNISTSKLNRNLPQKIYAFIKDIDISTLTFDYDKVSFYEGEEALDQYAAYNSTSTEIARDTLQTDDGTYYIYNKQQAWIRCQSLEWTNITLIRRFTSLANNTPYTSTLEQISELFKNYPNLEGKLLFEITIVDKKAVEIHEVYYTINNN